MAFFTTGNEIADAMQGVSLTGNIIPAIWYQHITRENGKPHLLAINLLADIVYWYRPTEIRDEQTGALCGYKKKFAADLLQRSYADIAEFFGCSKVEATRAVVALEQMGLIQREFRTIVVNGVKCNNVLFIKLFPEKLKAISGIVDTCQQKIIDLSTEKSIGVNFNVDTNTKNTSKTTQKISQDKKDIYTRIISHLNQKAGTNYRQTTASTQRLINARIADGFTVDDFIAVIDKKCAEWKGSDMQQYLRPETLFNGTKFESYLNSPIKDNRGNVQQNQRGNDSAVSKWGDLPGCKIV